jgi:general secretion pathway protein D
MYLKQLRVGVALAALALLLTTALNANNKKGDKLMKQGAQAEEQKDYDKAVDLYNRAVQADANDPGYQLAERRARFESAEAHTRDGLKLREQQKLDDALVELQKAYITDPSYTIALQEIHNTEQMIRERAKLPANSRVLSPVQKAEKAIETRVKSLQGPPELKPLNNQITNLRMNNQSTRVLYDTVAKLAGINVLFDSQGTSGFGGGQQNFNLDLNRVTLEEALDYIALETNTFWKAVSSNAIFVTADTAQKRQQYQDQVVKVFYIQNVGSQAEFQDFFNAVRTGANMTRGLIQLPSQNALIARGTPDQIAVVEKIIHDLDHPKPEVLIDVLVLEVNKQYARTLSAALAGATGGLKVPIIFNPRNSIGIPGSTGTTTSSTTTTTTGTTTGALTGLTTSDTTSTGTTGTTTSTTGTTTTGTTSTTGTTTNTSSGFIGLNSLGHISSADFATTLPGALIQALMTDSTTHVLQRPQLRATDGGKASLKIGSKIPYVSGSLNSAVATAGAIPYATTQFQQVDVGTNLDMEPRVNGPDDITLHVKIEISEVTTTENIGGVDQPVIGQNVNEANIRVKDGEMSVLGGLTNRNDTSSVAGIPGVTNMPVLGYLFGSKTKLKNDQEILIAITPHIIRAPDLSALSEPAIETGTESDVRVLRSVPSSASITITPVPGTVITQPEGQGQPQAVQPQPQGQPQQLQPQPQSQPQSPGQLQPQSQPQSPTQPQPQPQSQGQPQVPAPVPLPGPPQRVPLQYPPAVPQRNTNPNTGSGNSPAASSPPNPQR